MSCAMLVLASGGLFSAYVSGEGDRKIIETLKEVVESQQKINQSLVDSHKLSADIHTFLVEDVIELCKTSPAECNFGGEVDDEYKDMSFKEFRKHVLNSMNITDNLVGSLHLSEADGCLYEVRQFDDGVFYYHKLECGLT